MKKETQAKKVEKWFLENDNTQMYYKDLANELNILVPNMRRILGQGTLKGIFTRVHKGIYKLNLEEENTTIKEDWINVIESIVKEMEQKGLNK